MKVPATGAASEPDGTQSDAGQRAVPDRALRALRARWRTASLASGWRFPRDWGLPEVDAVCAAVVNAGGTDGALPALAGLSRARAAAGAGLEETLTDLAALHSVLDTQTGADGFVTPDVDTMPSPLLRITAVAWADVALDQFTRAEVVDSLTGLPTAAYLRTRLGELYRQAERERRHVSEKHVLVVVRMDFTHAAGWSRLTGMILAAEALSTAFDGGESLASLGPSTVVAVAGREDNVATRTVRLRRELTQRLAVDQQLVEVGAPRINLVRLPAEHVEACDLLERMSFS